MAHLQGYRHDIFVSYAHAPQLGDWSIKVCESLGSALEYLLGCKAPQPGIDIWMDPELRGNQPLLEQLRTEVEGAAFLLIVMSRFYLESAWCGKEVAWFEAAARSRIAPRSRVFILHAEPTDKKAWPPTLNDLTGYLFHGDPRTARLPLPFGFIGNEEDRANFEAAKWNVSQQIRQQLEELRAEAAAPQPVVAPPPPPAKPSGGLTRLVFIDGPVAGKAPDPVERAIRDILRSCGADVFSSSMLGAVPRAPDAANQLFAKLVKAKAGCDGLLLVHSDPNGTASDWLLDYLSEVVPAARRIRADGSPPTPAVIDATGTDDLVAVDGVPVLKYGRPDFPAALTAWVQGLSQARGAD
jgi:hypothetical protein